MSDEADPGVSRGELAVLREFRAMRADLLAADVKRDAMIQHGDLLTQSVDNLKGRIEEIAKRDEADHDDLRALIRGMQTSLDGNDDKPGLRTRVDRLEQAQLGEKRTKDWAAKILGALAVAVITWLFSKYLVHT